MIENKVYIVFVDYSTGEGYHLEKIFYDEEQAYEYIEKRTDCLFPRVVEEWEMEENGY